MTLLFWCALALVCIWVIARFVLAVTSILLYIVLALGIVFFLVWCFQRFAASYLL